MSAHLAEALAFALDVLGRPRESCDVCQGRGWIWTSPDPAEGRKVPCLRCAG